MPRNHLSRQRPHRRSDVRAKRPAGSTLAGAVLVLGGLGGMAAPAASAHDWYVDGAYGNSSNPGTSARPFKTFLQANDAANPGDNIYLKPTTVYPTLWVTKSGTAAQPIVIAGTGLAPNLTQVSGGGLNFGVSLFANYVTLTNFDITAPSVYSAIQVPQHSHHLTITGNRIHDAGGNGVSVVGADYVTISYNSVFGNAHNTANNNFASGISIKGSLDVDTYYGLKLRITGNLVYANTNVPTCATAACWAKASDSDGSGIIMDNNRRTTYDNIWYRGRTLISNNVVFGNGGRGIHMYLSDHISVNGNTLYSNNQDPYEGNYRPGEITGAFVSDIAVYSNILDSDGGQGRNNGAFTGTHVPIALNYCNTGFGQIIVRNNLGFRPQNDPASFLVQRGNTLPVVVNTNFWSTPLFERASLDPQLADFRVKPTSLALRNGYDQQALQRDMAGTLRLHPTTIGAYENPGP